MKTELNALFLSSALILLLFGSVICNSDSSENIVNQSGLHQKLEEKIFLPEYKVYCGIPDRNVYSRKCLEMTPNEREITYLKNKIYYFRIEHLLLQKYGGGPQAYTPWVAIQNETVIYVTDSRFDAFHYSTPCDYQGVIGNTRYDERDEIILLPNIEDVLLDPVKDIPPPHPLEGHKINYKFTPECKVIGINRRIYVVLNLRRSDLSTNSDFSVPITFLLDTGSPTSFMKKDTFDLLQKYGFTYFRNRNTIGVSIPPPLNIYEFKESSAHYHNINLLGMDFISDGYFIFYYEGKNNKCTLERDLDQEYICENYTCEWK